MFSQAPRHNSECLFLDALVPGSWLGAVNALCALFGFPVAGVHGWRAHGFCVAPNPLSERGPGAEHRESRRSSAHNFINVLLSCEPEQAEEQWDFL